MERQVVDNDRKVSLCHVPAAEWNGKRRDGYHVHGRLHNRRDEVYKFMPRYGSYFPLYHFKSSQNIKHGLPALHASLQDAAFAEGEQIPTGGLDCTARPLKT